MLAGDTDPVAWPCDQGTSRGRVSQLKENSSKIGAPTGNRASDAGRDLSEGSELAKKENDHILLDGCQWSVASGPLLNACACAGWRSMAFVFYSELWTTDSSAASVIAFNRGDSVPFGSLHRVAAGVAEGSKSISRPVSFARAKAVSTTMCKSNAIRVRWPDLHNWVCYLSFG